MRPNLLTPTRSPFAASGPRYGAAVGLPGPQLYYTTDELLEKYNRIDPLIQGLMTDMINYVKANYPNNAAALPQDVKALYLEYRTFAAQWGELRPELGAVLASSTGQWAEMDNYYNRYKQYRQRWQAFGQPVTAPLLPADAVDSNNKPLFGGGASVPGTGFNWNALTYLGVAVVALLLLREIRPERQLVTASSAPRMPERTTVRRLPAGSHGHGHVIDAEFE